MRLAHLIAVGLVVTACAPAADEAASNTMMPLSAAALDSVRAVDAAFAAAMNAGDSAAVMAIYTDDARLMPPDAPILEGEAIGATLAGFLAGGATDFVLNTIHTYGIGDLAYSIGTADYTMGGERHTVKYTEVLRRGADGKWRYQVDMFSGVAPPPAAEE